MDNHNERCDFLESLTYVRPGQEIPRHVPERLPDCRVEQPIPSLEEQAAIMARLRENVRQGKPFAQWIMDNAPEWAKNL